MDEQNLQTPMQYFLEPLIGVINQKTWQIKLHWTQASRFLLKHGTNYVYLLVYIDDILVIITEATPLEFTGPISIHSQTWYNTTGILKMLTLVVYVDDIMTYS